MEDSDDGRSLQPACSGFQHDEDPTWQVEERVQNIKPLRIISLDELVWVSFTNLRAGKKKKKDTGRPRTNSRRSQENTAATTVPTGQRCSRHVTADDVRPSLGGRALGKNSPPEENESVDTDQDVAVGVHLQEVPIHGVKHEPPGDGSKGMSQEVYDSFLLPLENGRFLKMKVNMCVCVSYLVGKEGS